MSASSHITGSIPIRCVSDGNVGAFPRWQFGLVCVVLAFTIATASRLAAETKSPDADKLRELSVSYGNLADEHLRSGDVVAARAWLEKAVQIDTELLRLTPDSELAQRDLSVSTEQLGDVLRQLNDLAGARRQYEQSRDLRHKLVERRVNPDQESRRDLSISLERLGVVHRVSGDWNAATESLQAALRLREQIAVAAPGSAAAKRELSVTLVLLGDVQMSRGRLDEARSWFERSLRLDQDLWEAARADVTTTRDLSISHERLGDLYLRLAETSKDPEQVAKARGHFEHSVKLREAVAAASGNSTSAQQDLALAFNRVGEACLKLSETATARRFFERALSVRRSLATGNEVSRPARRDLLRAYEKIGRLSLQLGFTDRARENFEQARQLAEALRKESSDADLQADGAGVAGYLGEVEMQAEDFVAAGHWFEQGIAVLDRLATDDSSTSAVRWRGWLTRQRAQLADCQQAEQALRDLDVVVTVATTNQRRAAVLLRLRARDQARRMVPADSAESLRKAIGRAEAKHWVSFARWLSLAAAAVGEPTERLNPPEVIERRKYVSLAIELLQEVRKSPNGPATLKQLATDADFAPLRSDSRFQELLKATP